MSMRISLPRASQHALLPRDPRGYLVAVEGPIGVGKTTLARRLAEQMGADLLLEVVEENPFLHGFYQDIRGRAFPTQLFFLLSRHRQQRSVANRLSDGGTVVCDYMFAKDRLFASLTLDANELALYETVYELIAPQVPSPDAVVFLRAEQDTLLRRIAARGRPFERALGSAYLARLAEAYDAYFERFDGGAVITVDTDALDLLAEAGLKKVVGALAEVLA